MKLLDQHTYIQGSIQYEHNYRKDWISLLNVNCGRIQAGFRKVLFHLLYSRFVSFCRKLSLYNLPCHLIHDTFSLETRNSKIRLPISTFQKKPYLIICSALVEVFNSFNFHSCHDTLHKLICLA